MVWLQLSWLGRDWAAAELTLSLEGDPLLEHNEVCY